MGMFEELMMAINAFYGLQGHFEHVQLLVAQLVGVIVDVLVRLL